MTKPPFTTAAEEAQESLQEALRSALAHAKIQRGRGRTGKSTAKLAGAKKDKKSKPKKPARTKRGAPGLTAPEQAEVDCVVSREMQQHGIYEPVDFQLVEVVKAGKREAEQTTRVVVNHGGTPVERWHRRGRIDDRQRAAIMVYQGAHRVTYGEPRVIANYSAFVANGSVMAAAVNAALEMHASSKMHAKGLLRLFDQEIFFRRGLDDFNVWQNVVLYDKPAGIAGQLLGFRLQKQAEAVAQVVVSSIAHEIANLIIDQAPPDLSQLMVDINAPRKSRRNFP